MHLRTPWPDDAADGKQEQPARGSVDRLWGPCPRDILTRRKWHGRSELSGLEARRKPF